MKFGLMRQLRSVIDPFKIAEVVFHRAGINAECEELAKANDE
ncbi:hypothetical protein GCM10025794_04410 [Massilia kyonggiensis]